MHALEEENTTQAHVIMSLTAMYREALHDAAFYSRQAARLSEERDAALAVAAQKQQGLTHAVEALRKVGDDYPGSSCQLWCHTAAQEAEAMAAGLEATAIPPGAFTDDSTPAGE